MPDRLNEIRARLDAATPGEWVIENDEYISAWDGHPSPHIIARVENEHPGCPHDKDAQFIAHAPADIAWLLAEVERLRGEA